MVEANFNYDAEFTRIYYILVKCGVNPDDIKSLLREERKGCNDITTGN